MSLTKQSTSPATPHITAQNCTESAPHRFITEASELGWKPGHWPERATTSMGNGLDFILTARKADGTRIYRQASGCISLTVLND